MGDTTEAEVVHDAVATAVQAAKHETGFVEPRPALERSLAQAARRADDSDASGPSAADLDQIDADPKLRETYRRLQRRFQAATGSLVAKGRDAEQALQAVDTIRADPKGAARALAAATGVRLDEPNIADRIRAKLTRSIGSEAAEALTPALVDGVREIAGELIQPLARDHAQREAQAASAAMSAAVQEFARSVEEAGGEWNEEVEREMAALVGRIEPGPRTSVAEYLEALHNTVTHRRKRARRRTEAPRGVIRPGMNAREAAQIAVAAARHDLRQ